MQDLGNYEFKLQLDGSIAGPDKSKKGRTLISSSLFVEEKLTNEELISLFQTYYLSALQGIIKRTQSTISPNIAYEVGVQSIPYVNEGEKGILYCVMAEVDKEKEK